MTHGHDSSNEEGFVPKFGHNDNGDGSNETMEETHSLIALFTWIDFAAYPFPLKKALQGREKISIFRNQDRTVNDIYKKS